MKKLIIFLVLLMALPMVFAGSMTRQATKTTVAPGETFSIIYSSPTASPAGWSVDDGVPPGFNTTTSITLCKDDWGADPYTIKCRTRFGGAPVPYTETLIAPMTPGEYRFDDSQYILWSDSSDSHTDWTKFSAITITVGTSNCTESWTCGDWSACAADKTQTRTCTDTNNCGSAFSKPVVSQTCGDDSCTADSNDIICKIMTWLGIDRLMATGVLVMGVIVSFFVLMMLIQMLTSMGRR